MRAFYGLLVILLVGSCGDDSPGAPSPAGAAETVQQDTHSSASDSEESDATPDSNSMDSAGPLDSSSAVDVESDTGESLDTATVEDGSEDTNAEDSSVSSDVVTPVPPAVQDGVMFRVSTVEVVKPTFCMEDGNGSCADVSAILNAYLGSHLTTTEQPLDILGLFKPFDFDPVTWITMSFGRGECERNAEGDIVSCAFYGPPTFFEETKLFPPGLCEVFSGFDACYSTSQTDMLLDLAGVPLGLKEAFTVGRLVLDDDLNAIGAKDAFVQGFMSQSTAEATEIALPGLGLTAIADLLLAEELEELDGEMGWWFEVNYSMTTVPF